MNPTLVVATIKLDTDGDDDRGQIQIIETEEGWEIDVDTPDGIEDPQLGAYETPEAAKEAIEATWGRGPWDLQWV